MSAFIKRFAEIMLSDIPAVGGKNASLGEMIVTLGEKGIKVPDGFATTAEAFWHFIDSNQLREPIKQKMDLLDRKMFANLSETGTVIRNLIAHAVIPADLQQEIKVAYRALSGNQPIAVAVRSSATAEDLPGASFAGQHESYLNITGEEAVLHAVLKCYVSLFTDRAIKYREDNGFDYSNIALSAGVQRMVRSDKACSGVCFTLEPESGFRDIVHIAGVWGLGETIVQGAVTPDEYYVFKPTLRQRKNAIAQKKLGTKEKTMLYAEGNGTASTIVVDTNSINRERFVLSDDEIIQLAKWSVAIEDHYEKPMDIEWAKDGLSGELFIIQARPETVHSKKNPYVMDEYELLQQEIALVNGQAIGSKIAVGIARLLKSPKDADRLAPGEIVVTDITSPDWDPLLKNCAAIVTNKGGRTSHASIVAREMGVPAVVGTQSATDVIIDGQLITVVCSEGNIGSVYNGRLAYNVYQHDFSKVQLPIATKPMLILGEPDKAFRLSFYPNAGVGLMRMEFIITNFVQVHPMALVKFDTLQDEQAKEKIVELTRNYQSKEEYFVDKLSQGIATIAAAFYPKDVIVRTSDFKTNEYASLVGGKDFEPNEENPMIGFRGASRYYSPLYKAGFKLECEAINKVRGEMGLTNVKVMIPFCRTYEEAKQVIAVMKEFGLDRYRDPALEIYVMVEIPSNVLEADRLAEVFDGFSIGSNDLTQLTLGIDRDSSLLASQFNEQHTTVKTMIGLAIDTARYYGKKIGLCGQAASDFPEFARFLVKRGINSVSFTSEAILKGIENITEAELHATSLLS
jgi:pyruvate, water dikinase